MNRPLFITARFRTGSTMLWNLFRQLAETRAYYEPLHDFLPSFIKYPVQAQKSHLFVKSYFDEYLLAPKAISLHQVDFANSRLHLESGDDHRELYTYIQALVESVPPGQTAVLQFNRIDFRLAWIKKSFPNARILHLTRNPRDLWHSTLAPFKIEIDKFIDFDGYDLATWARDLYKEFPFLAAPHIEHAYQRFYYLWKLSYLAGQRLSHLSIAYENILAEPKKCVTEILNFANLYSDNNLETCLKFIEPKPERSWNKEQSDAWFADMEQRCESVLDELGLNKNFSLIPLNEIQEQSPQYQALLHNPENEVWFKNSSRRAIAQERIAGYESNQYLNHGYKNAVEERDKTQAQLYEIKVERDAVEEELHLKIDNIQFERDSLLAELQHVYNSRSYPITAPMRAVFGLMREWRGWLKRTIKKGLMWTAKEVERRPWLKTKALSLLNHFPRCKIWIKKWVKGMEHENSLSDILPADVNSLSLRGRQIYHDLLKAFEEKKTRE